MKYIKKDEIKIGQRLAKPIFNKDGVLLYSRGTVVNINVLHHIESMTTYGFYVLDAAEPLPVISEEELEFERFQTTACVVLQEELEAIMNGNSSKSIDTLALDIVNRYGNLSKKITFIQYINSSIHVLVNLILMFLISTLLMNIKMNQLEQTKRKLLF